MGLEIAQVVQPVELPAMQHDNDNDKNAAKNYAEARQRQRQQQNERSGLNAARFAYSRRNGILDLMHMRFGGSCHTDDADVFAEMLIPFIVEAATLHRSRDGSRRDPYEQAHACLSHALPIWMNANAEQLPTMIAAAVECRAEAVAVGVPWLPAMPDLVAALRPTREEARHLRGWGCIDPASPEERREADRMRKRAERAAKGATPREESISAQKPWEALGISRAKWYRLRQQDRSETRETNSSGPYPTGEGADETVSLGDADWSEAFAFLGAVICILPEELAQYEGEFPDLDVLSVLPAIDAQFAAQGWEPQDVGPMLGELLQCESAEAA